MSDELSPSIVQEDSEEFLSLEEGDNAPEPEVPEQQTGESSPVQTTSITEAEVIDMEVLGEYSGTHTISWPIQDMDCPHCASEAMSALNRLDLVNNSIVSATEGTVTIDIDFEKGSISQASSILSSLGNGPDLPFMEIDGVKASDVAARHSTSVKNLPRIFRRQPGVLNCEIEKEGYIILQIVPNLPNELRKAMESSIRNVIGGDYRLVTLQLRD